MSDTAAAMAYLAAAPDYVQEHVRKVADAAAWRTTVMLENAALREKVERMREVLRSPETLKRVARALCLEATQDPDERHPNSGQPIWFYWKAPARAALDAIGEV